MVGKTVLAKSNFQHEEPMDEIAAQLPSALEVVSALCFLIGIIQLLLYLCRLGVLATLLSDALVSGFTTGAALHVFTSQVKDLFGLVLPKFPGNFDVLFTYYEIFKNIAKLNYVATSLSVVTCLILIFNNEYLKPRVQKHTIVPVPMELILIVGGTLASRYLNLAEAFGVDTIKYIPTGFPSPRMPNFSIMSNLLPDAFFVALVSYSITVSMALIFSKKENYKIDFNQELLAMSAGNLFGSGFQCIPFAASLSRSVIQHTVGGKTQIASLVSCGILVFILLWIGPFFEALPKAVLAGIIIVSLKGLLWQFRQLPQFWKLGRIDGFIWLITFTVVVAVAIDIGLLVGIGVSLLCLVVNGLKPYACLMGCVPGTEIFLDLSKYKRAQEIENIRIFHYLGSINFATHDNFKNLLYKKVQFKADKGDQKNGYPNDVRCVIIDLSCTTYVDASGVKTLRNVVDDMKNSDVDVLVTTSASSVFERLQSFELHENGFKFNIFPTIHDAVQFAYQRNIPITVRYETFPL